MKKALFCLIAATGLVSVAGAASAAVVCNDEGDCWKTTERYEYKPEFRVRVYDDNWKWKEGEKYRWRDAGHGRGYYRGGVWIGF